MNMKKTMAAIAAGAVAVSAMATSVSAIQDATFTYNLVENYKKDGDAAKMTLEATFNVANADVANFKVIEFVGGSLTNDKALDIKNVTVKVQSNAAGEQSKTYVYSTDNKGLNYNVNLKNGGKNWGTGLWENGSLTFVNELKNYDGDLTITVTVESETSLSSNKKVNLAIDGGDVKIIDAAKNVPVTPTVVRNYTASGDSKYLKLPFKTSLTDNLNIIHYLQNGKYGKVKDNDNNYTNVAAVLNDAIANYEGVVFRFNTAKQNIAWIIAPGAADWNVQDNYSSLVGAEGGWVFQGDCGYWDGGNQWNNMDGNDRKMTYKDLLASVAGDESKLVAMYVDYGGTDAYTKFNQHLYNGTVNQYYNSLLGNYASEGTGYVGFDWNGYNLFQGALVVNENLTMSLSDTDFFDYTETTLSFDWDAIYSNAMTSNNFATYVQSIKLATSTTWYWDSMDVILTAGAAEDASSGAGTTGDEDTLDDNGDDDGDDISLDDDGDDDDTDVGGDDDDDDDNADADNNDTQAPAQTASNPQTGNASVALAVIPVALAAAAIVAKKRG